MKVAVFTDGGARGNPGIAGSGVVVIGEDQKIMFEEAKFLGVKTNNEAEYLALISALSWLRENTQKEDEIEINSDSQLLVRQMKGVYKIKAAHLKELWAKAKELTTGRKINFKEIPREENYRADSLANRAMDSRQ